MTEKKQKDLKSKLLSIQTELVATKDQRNNFGNYNYRSAEIILEKLKPLLLKENVSITITDEIISVAERVYVKATITLVDCDSQESFSTSAFAREAEDKKGMDAAQITGSASSYARKYALSGLFLLDDNKDPDALNNNKEYTQTTRTTLTNQLKKACNDLKKQGLSNTDIQKAAAEVVNKSMEDMTDDELSKVVGHLQNKASGLY